MAREVDAAEPDWTGRLWSAHVRTAVVAGRRLHYLDVGTGPVVLLVHGLGASWQVWYQNIDDLSTGHRVIAVDLPGFGLSQALSRPAAISGYAESLVALLDLIGVERAVVVGHSLGGLVGQWMAARHGQRVAGLLLVGSADGIVDARQAVTFRSMALASSMLALFGRSAFLVAPALGRLLRLPPLRRRLIAQVMHDPDRVPPELADVMILSVLGSPAIGDAIGAGLRGDLAGELRRIQCPVVILAGERDRLVPAASSRRLAEAMPHARYDSWEDVGHHPMLERPGAFNALVRSFCAELDGVAQ